MPARLNEFVPQNTVIVSLCAQTEWRSPNEPRFIRVTKDRQQLIDIAPQVCSGHRLAGIRPRQRAEAKDAAMDYEENYGVPPTSSIHVDHYVLPS